MSIAGIGAAILGVFKALPEIAKIIWYFIRRKERKETEDEVQKTDDEAGSLDPDELGPSVRDRM